MDDILVNNLKNVVDGIDKWKFSTFDKIKRQKIEMMTRLEGIQRKFRIHDNVGGMRRLDDYNLQKELSYIFNQEELLWHQRSRTK